MPENPASDPKLLKFKGYNITLVDGRIKVKRDYIAPVYSMYDRGKLSISQFSAAKYIYQCCYISRGNTSGCKVRERIDGGIKIPEMTTSQVSASIQYAKGRKAAGKDWPLLERVCIDEEPLAGQHTSGYRRARLLHELRRGLNKVAACFGI